VLRARGRHTADNFGDVPRVPLLVPGVDALGRERKVEVLPDLEPRLLQARENHLVGGAGVRGAVKDHEHLRMQVPGDLSHGGSDIGDVRVPGLAEWRGNADVDGVHCLQHGEVKGRLERPGVERIPDPLGRHILDVRLTLAQKPDLLGVSVDPYHVEAGTGELHAQRQPDVAQSDHCQARLPGLEFLFEQHVLPLLNPPAAGA
jgi:hypothetical protein